MHPMLRKTIAQFLAGLMVYITVAPAFAGLVGTQSLLNDSGAAPQRALIRSLLQRAEARDILADYGVSQEWAVERVDRMTEEEVTQIDHLPAGGDILVLFLLVFLILIVLEAVGVIDLFTFM